jgi:hypothetical protein
MKLNDGTDWHPDDSDLRIWRNAYPGVDVEGEYRKMEAWLHSNPQKRKTLRGIKRFVNTWLKSARPAPAVKSSRETTLAEDLSDTSWAQ